MLEKLKKKYNEVDLKKINNILLIISFLILVISFLFLNNHWLFVPIFLFIFELSCYTKKNRAIRFISDILFILLISYFLLPYIEFSVIDVNLKKVLNMIIKILLTFDYFMIIIWILKQKKLKYVRRKIKGKKYTFKELRKNKYDYFKRKNETLINDYIKNENIDLNSDYYEVLSSNLENKTKNDLEEYVHTSYLRFYKHKKYSKKDKLDKLNFVFMLFHVTILLLTIIVR